MSEDISEFEVFLNLIMEAHAKYKYNCRMELKKPKNKEVTK